MPRKPIDDKGLADLFKHIQNHGIAELQTKGLTEDEESREMKKAFQDIYQMGYEYIHTLKVVPADGREPYFVHVDSLDTE